MSITSLPSNKNRSRRGKLEALRGNWRGELEQLDDDALLDDE